MDKMKLREDQAPKEEQTQSEGQEPQVSEESEENKASPESENESREPKEPEKDEKSGEDAAKEEDEKPTEMRSELVYLDKKYDSDGNRYYRVRKNQDGEGTASWWRLYALAETRHHGADDGRYRCTRLHVNPQPLKKLLEDVVVDYPNEPIDAESVVEIDLPACCLFFYRRELEAVGTERFRDDGTSLGHLRLLLGWIDRVYEEASRALERFRCSEKSRPIAYEHLWTIFKPGTLVYSRMLGQPRAFRLVNLWYETHSEPCLVLTVRYVDYDGDKFGTREETVRVPRYTGAMRCEDLNMLPLEFHPRAAEVRARLLDRGRRFRDLTGQHFRHYRGLAIRRLRGDCISSSREYQRFHVDGRVVVDCKTFHRLEPDLRFWLDELEDRTEAAKRQRTMRTWNKSSEAAGFAGGGGKEKLILDELHEEDLLVANATVRGFDFTDREFLEFFVDNLSSIEWDDGCFDQLVLDPVPKRTVQALVSMHVRRGQDDASAAADSFDDIIPGKGKGLVMVLHGPPGVGKTLTAECVAEWAHRPLYVVAAGDLGTDSRNLEQKLRRIMDITSTWGAVLLIDEADVFLERRSLHEMNRNAMVSVFLRILECTCLPLQPCPLFPVSSHIISPHPPNQKKTKKTTLSTNLPSLLCADYRGILFLTTNRVGTFDEALTSRIHVPIRYSSLDAASRRAIWRNFCERVPGAADDEVVITEEQLDRLARHELNGRQIKNIVKTAESLAAFEGRRLDAARLEDFTRVQGQFESDWMGFTEITG